MCAKSHYHSRNRIAIHTTKSQQAQSHRNSHNQLQQAQPKLVLGGLMKKFKKLFVILVLLLMVSPLLVSCKDKDEKVVRHVVSWVTNSEDSTIGNMEVAEGSFIAQPANPARTGYVFQGWFLDSDFKTQWIFTEHKVTAAITLYAYWLNQEYRITIPTTSLVADGYVVEKEKSVVFYDEGVAFSVTVYDGVKSSVIVKARNEAQNYINQEKIVNGTKYYFNLQNIRTNIDIRVENVEFKTNTVYFMNQDSTFTIHELGAPKAKVPYGHDYKFYVEMAEAYSQSQPVAVQNGEELDSVEQNIGGKNVRVYSLSSVKQNAYVDIVGILRNVYTREFSVSNRYVISGNENILHGTTYSFKVVMDEAYTQNNIDNLEVKMGTTLLPFTKVYNADTRTYTVTVPNVTGTLNISLVSAEWTINKYAVSLPATQQGYQLISSSHFVAGGQIEATHGDNVVLLFALHENYNNSDYVITVNNFNITSAFSADGEYLKYTLTSVRSNATFAVSGVEENYFTVALQSGTEGVALQFLQGGEKVNVTSTRQVVFSLDLLEGYEFSTSGVTVFANEQPIEQQNGNYTISDINSNIEITVEGVSLIELSTDCPTLSGASVNVSAPTVFYGGYVDVVVQLLSSHSKSMQALKMSYDGTELNKTIDGNEATFRISNITEDLTSAKFEVEGLQINTYTVTFPSQQNFTISGNSVFEHGEEVSFSVGAAEGYDITTLKFKINGVDFDAQSTITVPSSMTEENLVIVVSSIIAKFSYKVVFSVTSDDELEGVFENFGSDERYSSNQYEIMLEHGEAITPPAINPTAPENYTFDGWAQHAQTATEITTILPIYKKVQHTLTLELLGGTLSEGTQIIFDFDDVPVLADLIPVREGYTFEGWYKDAAKTELITELESKSQTLYANYVITVGVDKNYQSLSYAVDMATSGDKVVVDAGTYSSGLLINKDITIVGAEAGAIIDLTDTSEYNYSYYQGNYYAICIYPTDEYGNLVSSKNIRVNISNITIKVKSSSGFGAVLSLNSVVQFNDTEIVGGAVAVSLRGGVVNSFSMTNSKVVLNQSGAKAIVAEATSHNYKLTLSNNQFDTTAAAQNAVAIHLTGTNKIAVILDENIFGGCGENNIVLQSENNKTFTSVNDNEIDISSFSGGIVLTNYVSQIHNTTQISAVVTIFENNDFGTVESGWMNCHLAIALGNTRVQITFEEEGAWNAKTLVYDKNALLSAIDNAVYDIYSLNDIVLASTDILNLRADSNLFVMGSLVNNGTISVAGTLVHFGNIINNGTVECQGVGSIINANNFMFDISDNYDVRVDLLEVSEIDEHSFLISGNTISAIEDARVFDLFGANHTNNFVHFSIYVGVEYAGISLNITLENVGGLTYGDGTHIKVATDIVQANGYLEFVMDTNNGLLSSINIVVKDENGIIKNYDLSFETSRFEPEHFAKIGSGDIWVLNLGDLVLEEDEEESVYVLSGNVFKSSPVSPATIALGKISYLVALDLYVGIEYAGDAFDVLGVAFLITGEEESLQPFVEVVVDENGYVSYVCEVMLIEKDEEWQRMDGMKIMVSSSDFPSFSQQFIFDTSGISFA